MIRLKHVTLLIAMAMVVGCSTIHTQLVDPVGRSIPDPSYTIQIIGKPIFMVFYYAAYEHTQDVDGSVIAKPIYLDCFKHHDIYTSKIKAITLTIEVNNPHEIEYSLYQKIDAKIGKGSINWKEVQMGGEVNRSKMPYRQFVYRLPYGEEVRHVDNLVSIYIDNNEVGRIGTFQYSLIH